MPKKSIFIKSDTHKYNKLKGQDIEHICELSPRSMGCKHTIIMREWYGETETQYFYIRYLCGILNVSLGDCEMDAKYDYTPIAMADDLIDLDDDDRKHIINHICNFLHWKLPPGDVDSISC